MMYPQSTPDRMADLADAQYRSESRMDDVELFGIAWASGGPDEDGGVDLDASRVVDPPEMIRAMVADKDHGTNDEEAQAFLGLCSPHPDLPSSLEAFLAMYAEDEAEHFMARLTARLAESAQLHEALALGVFIRHGERIATAMREGRGR